MLSYFCADLSVQAFHSFYPISLSKLDSIRTKGYLIFNGEVLAYAILGGQEKNGVLGFSWWFVFFRFFIFLWWIVFIQSSIAWSAFASFLMVEKISILSQKHNDFVNINTGFNF